jgi:hypothetical protein
MMLSQDSVFAKRHGKCELELDAVAIDILNRWGPDGGPMGARWGPVGVQMGARWGPVGVQSGSSRGPVGVQLGSSWGPVGVQLGSRVEVARVSGR